MTNFAMTWKAENEIIKDGLAQALQRVLVCCSGCLGALACGLCSSTQAQHKVAAVSAS